MMFFGYIFARKEHEPLSNVIINHEKIHIAQAKDCGGYVWFYLLYAYYYFKCMIWALKHFTSNKNFFKRVYEINPFEKEAYVNQSMLNYIYEFRQKGDWKKYKSL